MKIYVTDSYIQCGHGYENHLLSFNCVDLEFQLRNNRHCLFGFLMQLSLDQATISSKYDIFEFLIIMAFKYS